MSIKTLWVLKQTGLATPPKWLPENTHYETIVGSTAYGVSSDTSDVDIYGFCIPPRDILFPWLRGWIPGFTSQPDKFEEYQQHHIKDKDALGGRGRNYDITIYSIVKYFRLCMDNNPNMIDSLFTPTNCVTKQTQIAQHVRENRKLFLHKGAWFKFKGYAYSQLHKMSIKQPVGKRLEIIKEHGYDVKFAYHLVRLLNEVEQILIEHDLDLQRNREQLKAIRRGEWSEQQVRDYFTDKEKTLEKVYSESDLRHTPDQAAIKRLLVHCLETHYGSLDKFLKCQ